VVLQHVVHVRVCHARQDGAGGRHQRLTIPSVGSDVDSKHPMPSFDQETMQLHCRQFGNRTNRNTSGTAGRGRGVGSGSGPQVQCPACRGVQRPKVCLSVACYTGSQVGPLPSTGVGTTWRSSGFSAIKNA